MTRPRAAAGAAEVPLPEMDKKSTRMPRLKARIAPRLFDVDQAGDYIGMAPRTIRAYIAEGVIPVVKPPAVVRKHERSSRVLIDRDDLDALVATWKQTR